MDPEVLDDIILRLLEVKVPAASATATAKKKKWSWFRKKEEEDPKEAAAADNNGGNLSESEIRQLCVASTEIFLQQPNLLRLEAPMAICGDILGEHSDLLTLLEIGGFPPATNYLFLGNYVDYGKKRIKAICLLLAYKIKYPDNFFLLRGRNERATVNFTVFEDCFNSLPTAALINEKIFCVHAGICPELKNLQQIDNITRPTDVPSSGLLYDLLWSDPSMCLGWRVNASSFSYDFGPDKVSEFLQKHNLDLICRGDHVAKHGYKFFADRQLVSIFSAPNFYSKFVPDYSNAGALLIIDAGLMGSLKIFKWEGNKIKSNSSPSITTIPVKLVLPCKPLLYSDKKDKDTMMMDVGTSFDNDDNMKTMGDRHGTTSQQECSNLPFETPNIEVFECSTIGLNESSYIKQAGHESVREDHLDNTEVAIDTLNIQIKQDLKLQEDVTSNLSNEVPRLKFFKYKEIHDATNGFSEKSKIGQGGYGSVYKCYLDSTEVAVKLLDANSTQGSNEFLQELDVLEDIYHPNLVRLVGACFKHRALVYEFLPNGSLEDCLKERPEALTWFMRTRIIFELCSTLIFLHSQKPQAMVHGDVKPHNVLLDANFSSKLADFGLCRFLPQGSASATDAFRVTNNIKGTEWYIDPDYLDSGKLTPGCDVYAFGITMLRILTGLSPTDILRKVEVAYVKKELKKIIDHTAGEWPDKVAEYLACMGLECCDPERTCSRLMKEISIGLKDILAKNNYT